MISTFNIPCGLSKGRNSSTAPTFRKTFPWWQDKCNCIHLCMIHITWWKHLFYSFAALSATKPLKVIVIEKGMERTCLFRDHFHKTQRTHHFSRTSQEYENCKQKKPVITYLTNFSGYLLATFFFYIFHQKRIFKSFSKHNGKESHVVSPFQNGQFLRYITHSFHCLLNVSVASTKCNQGLL